MVTFIKSIYRLFKKIQYKTETRLYTPEGLSIILDRDKSEKLRIIVKEYHATGQWDYSKLRELEYEE